MASPVVNSAGQYVHPEKLASKPSRYRPKKPIWNDRIIEKRLLQIERAERYRTNF